MDDLRGIPEFVDDLIAIVEQVVQVSDNRAQVLAGRDRAPAADGVEADRDVALGEQGGGVFRRHLVRVIDTEDEE